MKSLTIITTFFIIVLAGSFFNPAHADGNACYNQCHSELMAKYYGYCPAVIWAYWTCYDDADDDFDACTSSCAAQADKISREASSQKEKQKTQEDKQRAQSEMKHRAKQEDIRGKKHRVVGGEYIAPLSACDSECIEARNEICTVTGSYMKKQNSLSKHQYNIFSELHYQAQCDDLPGGQCGQTCENIMQKVCDTTKNIIQGNSFQELSGEFGFTESMSAAFISQVAQCK